MKTPLLINGLVGGDQKRDYFTIFNINVEMIAAEIQASGSIVLNMSEV